jgi:hypothetical protein
MKNVKIILVIFVSLFITFVIFSCTMDESLQDLKNSESWTNRNLSPYQDEDFRDLARVLSIGVNENLSLRTLLKTEALLKFDGDFDILVNKIKNTQILTNNGQLSISEYLGSIYERLNLSPKVSGHDGGNSGLTSYSTFPTKVTYTIANPTGITQISNANDIILYLVSVYPEIQISIPINIVNWDVTTYIPKCTYVPENYNESTTLTVEGFDDGSSILLDAVIEPNEPVIVVSNSERMQNPESLITAAPNVSIQLTGQATPIGLALSWAVTNPNNEHIEAYVLFRLSHESNQFTSIKTIWDKNQLVYFDNNVLGNETYSYYLVAFNAAGFSNPSNTIIINSPTMPPPASSFSANHYRQGEIELRWSYPQNNFIQNAKMYKRVIGIDSDYRLIGTFSTSVNYLIDNSINAGRISLYKLELVNFQGNSSPTYDFVDVPFRNINESRTLILNNITYDKNKKSEIEGWLRGEPEFEINVARTAQTGNATEVQKRVFCKMTGTSTGFDKPILSWRPVDLAEILTFEVVEIDGGPEVNLTVSAGFEFKNSSQTAFVKAAVDISFGDITNTKNENVGSREIPYRGIISPTIQYPLGGVRIRFLD